MSLPAQTTVQVVSVNDLSDAEYSPDMPYQCIVKLVHGYLDSSLQCAERQTGPFAKLNPLFDVSKLDSDSFSFYTFCSVTIGEEFTCLHDAEAEHAHYILKLIKQNTLDALANRIAVCLSAPIDYYPWETLLTFQTFKHDFVDAQGHKIQRYSLCRLSTSTDSKKLYTIQDISIKDETVSLMELARDNYSLNYLTIASPDELHLCLPSKEDSLHFEALQNLQPVFEFLGHCHQIELTHYIDHMIKNMQYSLSQAHHHIILRMLVSLDVPKRTIDFVHYSPIAEIDVKAALIKYSLTQKTVSAFRSLSLDCPSRITATQGCYSILVESSQYLRTLLNTLFHPRKIYSNHSYKG